MGVNKTELHRIEVDNAAIDGTGLPVRVINLIPGGLGGDASAANQLLENASLVSIDSKLPALSGGRVPVELPAGAGGLTDTELRAAAVPVSAAALPLPTGAATSAKQDVEHTDLTNLLTELQQKTEPADQQHVVIDSSATVPVLISDGSGPVTVDGTVAVSSSALPAGAATDAGLSALLSELQQKLEPGDIATLATTAKQDTGNTSLASIVAALALLTLAQGADGTATQGPMVQALADDAPPLRITGNVYPLSVTADGRLRVASAPSNADADFFGEMTPSFLDQKNDHWRNLPAFYF